VIQREIEHSLGVVQDIGSFFDASRGVGRRQFREFVGPALKRDPSIRALQWVPRVTGEEKREFLARARRGFQGFRITETAADGETVAASGRPEYFSVLYVQPYRSNKALLGFDLASVPTQRTALQQARDRGRMQVFERRLPGPDGSRQAGFAAYLPLYERPREEEAGEQESEETAAADPALLRGFAIGLFRFGAIVDRGLANLSPGGIDMRFIATSPEGEASTVYSHLSRLRGEGGEPGEGGNGGEIHDFVDKIQLANRRWSVVCTPIPGRYRPDPWSGRVVLGSGTAFTLLFLVYLAASIGRAQEVKRLVFLRTEQLEEANRALNKEIAERVHAESALQRLNTTLEQRVALRTGEAERRARELEQFAYVAAHDLKAPLRAIANLALWLKEDLEEKLTEQTREQLDLLRDRVARMHALIEGLLTYSRVGRTGDVVEEVESAALVAETIDSLSPPVGFRIDVAPDMPTLRTERLQLGQVFANLIGNGIRHHHREQGRIQVAGRDRGDYCDFTVSDDGPGIAPELHDKVFMMFQTLEVKDSGINTGIGLALVKKVVEEHGGTIELHSEPGRGSMFRFSWAKKTTAIGDGK
jgi:signal transduction histidine kinase